VWLFLTRYSMLDDSLIHLRYAANLDHLHFVTYDGVGHTFGTSSPLYLALLTVVFAIFPGVFVAKLVSVVIYLCLLLFTVHLVLREDNTNFSRGLAFCLLVTFCSPMGVRWLADGMESGLVCLMVLLAARATIGSATAGRNGILLFIYGLGLTLLRIELLALCGICSATIFVAQWHLFPKQLARALRTALPILCGGIAAMLLIHLIFGSFLPDTALAKAYNKPSIEGAMVFVQLMASSFALGLGVFIVWIVSAAFAFRPASPVGRSTLLVANSMFPILVTLSCVRGQAVQGVRYFLWAMLFSIAWNLWTLARAPQPIRLQTATLVTCGLLIACLLPFDTYYGGRTMLGRAKTFQQMRSSQLDHLSGHIMLADDIGFIGYFSQANVCDLNGLVNGRDFAALTQLQRIQACVDRKPDALFLTTPRVQMMRSYIPDLEEWTPCEKIDFPNVHSNDTHYLLVRTEKAATLCPAPQLHQSIQEILGPPIG
jgi:hypothetical protein